MKGKLEDEIDALFKLPLAEFTGERNALAARLKKDGRRDDADRVKLLGKPSVSAWAVNQLYWDHYEAFEDLIASGRRLHASRSASKAANMRESLEARREALSELSDLATKLLSDAGHSPSLDTMRRVTATLEALSTYALLPDGPTPGRLTNDVDPPSFESLALLISGAAAPAPIKEPARTKPKTTTTAEVRRLEEARRAKIGAAKVSLQEAKRSLTDARSRAQSLEAVQKKANTEAKEAEKHRREAEQRLEKAAAAADEAARRVQSVAAEIREVAQTVEEAKRRVEDSTRDLESLLRE